MLAVTSVGGVVSEWQESTSILGCCKMRPPGSLALVRSISFSAYLIMLTRVLVLARTLVESTYRCQNSRVQDPDLPLCRRILIWQRRAQKAMGKTQSDYRTAYLYGIYPSTYSAWQRQNSLDKNFIIHLTFIFNSKLETWNNL